MGLSLPKRFYRNRLEDGASTFEKVLIERLEAVVNGMRQVCPGHNVDFEKECPECKRERFVKDKEAKERSGAQWAQMPLTASITTLLGGQTTTKGQAFGQPRLPALGKP